MQCAPGRLAIGGGFEIGMKATEIFPFRAPIVRLLHALFGGIGGGANAG